MKIGILSRNKQLCSTWRCAEAVVARDNNVNVVMQAFIEYHARPGRTRTRGRR